VGIVGGGLVGVGDGSGAGDGLVVGVTVGAGPTFCISSVGGGVLANEGVQAGKLTRHTAVRKRSLIDDIILNSVGGMTLL